MELIGDIQRDKSHFDSNWFFRWHVSCCSQLQSKARLFLIFVLFFYKQFAPPLLTAHLPSSDKSNKVPNKLLLSEICSLDVAVSSKSPNISHFRNVRIIWISVFIHTEGSGFVQFIVFLEKSVFCLYNFIQKRPALCLFDVVLWWWSFHTEVLHISNGPMFHVSSFFI